MIISSLRVSLSLITRLVIVTSLVVCVAEANLFNRMVGKNDLTKSQSNRDIESVKAQLRKIVDLYESRERVENLRVEGVKAVNTKQQQEWRQQLQILSEKIEQAENQRLQRMNQISLDVISLKRELKSRINRFSNQYKQIKKELESKESSLKLLKKINDDMGNLAQNLVTINDQYLGSYNLEFVKKFQELEAAYQKAEEDWKTLKKERENDPVIRETMDREQALINEQQEIMQHLSQHIQEGLSGNFEKELEGLKYAIKQSNCPQIRTIADLKDENLRSCFANIMLQLPSLLTPASCKTIATPAAPKARLAINPDQPLKAYYVCAKEVSNADNQPLQMVGEKRELERPNNINILLQLDEQREKLDSLSTAIQQGNRKINDLGGQVFTAEKSYKQQLDKHVQQMQELSEKLRKLEEGIILARKIAQNDLNHRLDRLYVPGEDFVAQLAKAMTQEGGVALAQELIKQKSLSVIKDGGARFASNLFDRLIGLPTEMGSTYTRIDQNALSNLRALISGFNEDLVLIGRFKESKVYTPKMDEALQKLRSTYPNLEMSSGIMGTTWNWFKEKFTMTTPNLPADFGEKRNNLNKLTANYFQTTQDLIAEHSHAAEMLSTSIRQNIKRANCPAISGLNNLTRSNIAACLLNELNKLPPADKEMYFECQPNLVGEHVFACSQAVVRSPMENAHHFAKKIDVTTKLLKSFLIVENMQRQAHTQINQLGIRKIQTGQTAKSNQDILNDLRAKLTHVMMDLAEFRETWIKSRQEKLEELRKRHAISEQEYKKAYDEWKDIGNKILETQKYYNKFANNTVNLFAVVFQSHFYSNLALQEIDDDEPTVYEQLTSSQKLMENLGVGIKRLESIISNHETDPRYLRDAKKYENLVIQARTTLEEIGGMIDKIAKLSSNSHTVVSEINKQAQYLKCPAFQRFSDGARGVEKCRADYVQNLQFIGRKLNSSSCVNLNVNSSSLGEDVQMCLSTLGGGSSSPAGTSSAIATKSASPNNVMASLKTKFRSLTSRSN